MVTYSDEKGGLLDHEPRAKPSRKRTGPIVPLTLLALLLLLVCRGYLRQDVSSLEAISRAQCPKQPDALEKGPHWDILADEQYGTLAATRLSKAIQIETESFDEMPLDPSDPAWDKHDAFAHLLETEFPKVYSALTYEAINTHSHLFTWQGSDSSLKPVLFMAHQDTVPVLNATLDLWTYPPFSGAITMDATPSTPGTWIWGRGASDCKNSLMGIMGAVERLITEGFEPERTLLLGFGFDEEITGPLGAKKISETLFKRYGRDSIEFLVDEGFSGLSFEYGSWTANLGVAEKGFFNLMMKLETLGGHSSVPQEHTGSGCVRWRALTAVGIMAKILSALEDDPFKPVLNPDGPYIKYLQCMSDHAADFPSKLRSAIGTPSAWPRLAKELASERRINSFLATTQAIDLVNGGVKINALPEVVTAGSNYRVDL